MSDDNGQPPARLMQADWQHVDKPTLDDFRAADWAVIERQRGPYMAAEQARQALELLTASADAPTFGYQINNYQHCLQAATMAMRDGRDEETVVVALFHDLGFIVCPDTHGDFAAAFLRAYISDANHWMLRHHAVFQQVHVLEHPNQDMDPNARERWRGHPHFDWTAEFVAKYDQNSIQADYDTAPLETFVPMVQRLFARTPRPLHED